MNTPKEFLTGKPAYPGPQQAPPGLYKEQLLNSLKDNSRTDSSSLLKQLSAEIQSAYKTTTPVAGSESATIAAKEKSMIAWVDRFFDYFQDFCHELKSELNSHGIEIFCQRPVVCREVVAYDLWNQPSSTLTIFRGCLNTGSWTLSLRGSKDSIEAFIVPSDRYLSLSAAPETFRPLLKLQPDYVQNQVIWQLDTITTNYESIGSLAQQLFTYLWQFATGKRSESQLWVQAEVPPTTSFAPPGAAAQVSASSPAVSVAVAAQLLHDSIAQEISSAKDAGLNALKAQNLPEAQRINTYLNELRALHTGLTNLLSGWLAK